MLTTTLMLGIVGGVLLAAFFGLFRRPAGAPAQVVTINTPPAAARPPGCLAAACVPILSQAGRLPANRSGRGIHAPLQAR